ncbi:MAG: peptide chain release factor-like protein [Verrucomicrobiales bacterium]|nr:peptide chain release factor-like protein [Verrucomicrobiales bacterium]
MDPNLTERMERLLIREADLVEKFVHGSGPGGQKINKTASCVYLRHIPTGIEVHCQESRSRDRNREIARERLCERIEAMRKKRLLERAKIRAKKRYAKRKPSAATKAKVKQAKQIRSDKKKNRKRVAVKKFDE